MATATQTDRTFPALHGRPPTGWLNDPNGCGRIDGTWHVFYQYNPAGPVHEQIHWGHMSSPDLVRWRTEDVALAPTPGGPDEVGCWTGCLVDDGGIPTLIYSAVARPGGSSTVALARADRTMTSFHKDPTPAVGMPSDPSLTDVRDPYVFTVDGRRYAVQGAGSRHGTGRLLLYGCDDLTAWTELGTLLRADHPVVSDVAGANIWECPNLVPLGDEWLLVVSVWLGDGATQLSHTAWILGDLTADGDGLRFEPRTAGRLDEGPAFYAPQLTIADGRVLMWGWAWELDRTPAQVQKAGWAGALTFAREVTVVDGRVRTAPASELTALRGESVDPAGPLPAAFEVQWQPGRPGPLVCGSTPCWPEELEVTRVLVDGSLVEAFTADGTAYTTRAYPARDREFRLAGGRDGVRATALR